MIIPAEPRTLTVAPAVQRLVRSEVLCDPWTWKFCPKAQHGVVVAGENPSLSLVMTIYSIIDDMYYIYIYR